MVKGFHTVNKPYDRKMVVDYINGIDSLNDMDVESLSKKDKENIEYIYKDNFEFTLFPYTTLFRSRKSVV